MAEVNFNKNAIEEYKCDANLAIQLKLVKSAEDVEDGPCFYPEMSHQVFGSSETIFGYKDPEVKMYYSASKLTTYININYKEVITPQDFDGVQPDDVLQALSKFVPPGFYTNKDAFIASLEKEKYFTPFGEKLHSYTHTTDNITRHFEIYKNTGNAPGFKTFHEKLQTFLIWYVDAASFIDIDDERWMFYIIYEKVKSPCGSTFYHIVGYQTVYRYYAYPFMERPRISQVLVLPPFQKQGHGAELLQTFYTECWSNSDILDITVEDPSEDYQRVRDFVDTRNCMELESFSPENIQSGFTKEIVQEAREKFKINKNQSRRIYEIIRLKFSTTPDLLRNYRLDVKRRLHQPFQTTAKESSKLKALTSPGGGDSQISKKQKHEILEKLYNECVVSYRHILEKVAASI